MGRGDEFRFRMVSGCSVSGVGFGTVGQTGVQVLARLWIDETPRSSIVRMVRVV